nr:TerD family protein [Gordonia humi]
MTKGTNTSIAAVGDSPPTITVTIEVRSDCGLITDASVLLLGDDGRVRSSDDLIFYNQATGADGCVRLLDREADSIDDASRDTIRIDLAEISPDIARIVVGASVDDPETSFGLATAASLIVSVDTDTIATFPIDGLSAERALLFGEVYRRGDDWRIRAIGQGYENGLEALVTDFGVEVDNDSEHSTGQEQSSADSGDGGEHKTTPSNVQMRRRRRAVRLPADWADRTNAYLSLSGDDGPYHRASLFPAVHSKASTNHEQRATSIMLATMEVVREFGRAVLAQIGAPSGRVESFVEPEFTMNGIEARPDGLIRVTRGSTMWTALVEVKIGSRRLDDDQVNAYLTVAKANRFDAVITISGDLPPTAGDWGVTPDPKAIKSVALHHISWEEIIATAATTLDHTGIENRERRRLLREFLEFAIHPASGMQTFDDMGKHWVHVRDGVKTRTIGPTDAAARDVCDNFDRLIRHTGLTLSALIGQRVQAIPPAEHRDAVSRVRQLADSGQLFGTLRTAGLVGPLVIESDLTRDRTVCSITVPAPREGRPLTHVNWLLRQLPGAGSKTRIVSHHSGTKETTAVLLGKAREDPSVLVPGNGRNIREFTVSVDSSTGTKRAGTSGGFATAFTQFALVFYDEIASVLKTPTRNA